MTDLSLILKPVTGIPLVADGDNLAVLIDAALNKSGDELLEGDIVVIAQKIVSKAEGRIVDLGTVKPSARARRLATEIDKDPRLVELILSESREVLRCKPGVIIVQHRSGIVLANAGIDHSNVGNENGEQLVTLLPEDSDLSASRIRERFREITGVMIAVIISDSIGRAWRLGTTGTAIGSSGIMPLRDLRGNKDLFGETLQVTETADIDSLAAAAGLLMGEGNDGIPAVLIRGYRTQPGMGGAERLVRPRDEDLFR